MTERQPPDEPDDDENPEFDRFEELTRRLLKAKPKDGPPEIEDAAEDESEIRADETD